MLGRCLVKKGKTDEAENLLKDSLDMRRSFCPDDKSSFASSESLSCLTVTHALIIYPVVLLELLLQRRSPTRIITIIVLATNLQKRFLLKLQKDRV